MPSPFPGMDPYLESRDLWPDFHNRLAAEIGGELNRLLPARYFAKTEVRFDLDVYIDDESEPRRQTRVADGGVTREPGPGVAVLERVRREISPALEIRVATDPGKRPFVEIREAAGPHRIVTVIEILSPANKEHGRNRLAYADKQLQVLHSEANLVEIDLLRAGERVLPSPALEREVRHLDPRPDYLVLVSPAWGRDHDYWGYSLYPIDLRDILPCVGIPLRLDESPVALDLQYVFDRVYDAGPYRRGAADYAAPPDPPLADGDAAWAEGLLR